MRRARTLVHLGVPAGLTLALILGLPASRALAAPNPNLIIVGSASIEGEITSCGCVKRDLGGFARKATLIKQEREDGPVLLLDAGDFGADRGFVPQEKTAFIFDLMARLGYDAVTPGEREMVPGLDALKQMYAAHPEVNVVSANLMDTSGKRIWPEYVIVEKGGVKIGVTGVTGNAFYSFNVVRKVQKSDDFKFEDPATALRRVVGELQGKVDLVVALVHQPLPEVKKLVKEVPGVDVALVGHNPKYVFDPERSGDTLVLSPGTRGQYLSVLNLTLGPDGSIVSSEGEGKPVTEDYAKDPAFGPLVSKWEKDWKAREKAHNGEKSEGTR
jgi:2',3'-cyclic-nucleotide 2'-phosphodiesterase (5'-nucleotidase family)